MKYWLMCTVAGLLALGAPAQADVVGEEEKTGRDGVNIGPIRAGQLEVTPVMSVRFSNRGLFYRAGVQVAYSISRWHQIGGSFIAGNRQYDRRAGLDTPDRDDLTQVLDNATIDARGRYMTVDDGFGSSVSGFYRLNIPIQIKKRTFPFVEAFAARDFWGWGNVSELGGGAGTRQVLSKHTALTAMYGYSVLFAGEDRIKRHFVKGGVSVFFR